MEPCKVCVEKSDQIREILRPFQLEHVDPVGGVRILGKSLAEARAQVAALTAERDAAKAELAAAKQDTERLTLKATRDLPMSLNLVRLYSDEVWRLVGSGLMNSRSKLADITLDARGFLADLSERPLAAGAPEGTPPAIEMHCILCKDPAVYHADESAWRHQHKGLEGGQFLCEKYGYPIEVEPVEGTEGKDKDGEA